MGRIIHIYCDESRQTSERFMVLGGIAIPQDMLTSFNASIAKCRAEQNRLSEFKWNRITARKVPSYKKFLDCFFALTNTGHAHFHAIIIDTHQVRHARYGRDEENGFYTFYYQLLLHCFGRTYCVKHPDNTLLTYLDYRTSSYSLDVLKRCLNQGMRKKFSVATSPFHAIEPRDSQNTEAIQMTDVLIGAIGYKKNGFDFISDANTGKKEIMNHIISKSGLPSITNTTPKSIQRFTVWNFRLQN